MNGRSSVDHRSIIDWKLYAHPKRKRKRKRKRK